MCIEANFFNDFLGRQRIVELLIKSGVKDVNSGTTLDHLHI